MGFEDISFLGVVAYISTIIICALIRDCFLRASAALDHALECDNSSTTDIDAEEERRGHSSSPPLAPLAPPTPSVPRKKLRPYWSDPIYTEPAPSREPLAPRREFTQAEIELARKKLYADVDRRAAQRAKNALPVFEENTSITPAAAATTETSAAPRTAKAPVYTPAMFSLRMRAIEARGPITPEIIEDRQLRALPDHLQQGLIGRREDGLWLTHPIGYEPMLLDITTATLLPMNAGFSSQAQPVPAFQSLNSVPEPVRAMESFAPPAPVLSFPAPQYQAVQAPVVAPEPPRPAVSARPLNTFFPPPAARSTNMFSHAPSLLDTVAPQVPAAQPPVVASQPQQLAQSVAPPGTFTPSVVPTHTLFKPSAPAGSFLKSSAPAATFFKPSAPPGTFMKAQTPQHQAVRAPIVPSTSSFLSGESSFFNLPVVSEKPRSSGMFTLRPGFLSGIPGPGQ